MSRGTVGTRREPRTEGRGQRRGARQYPWGPAPLCGCPLPLPPAGWPAQPKGERQRLQGPATASHARQRERLTGLVSRPAGPWERATVSPAWASWANNVAFIAQGSQALGGGLVGTVVGGGLELGCWEAAWTFSLPLRADLGGQPSDLTPAGELVGEAHILCGENRLPPVCLGAVTEPPAPSVNRTVPDRWLVFCEADV